MEAPQAFGGLRLCRHRAGDGFLRRRHTGVSGALRPRGGVAGPGRAHARTQGTTRGGRPSSRLRARIRLRALDGYAWRDCRAADSVVAPESDEPLLPAGFPVDTSPRHDRRRFHVVPGARAALRRPPAAILPRRLARATRFLSTLSLRRGRLWSGRFLVPPVDTLRRAAARARVRL